MTDDQEKSSEPYQPGYFRCRRALERLRLFQDWVRHHQRWADEMQFARPIEELIPNEKDQWKIHYKIEEKIAELSPMVYGHLHDAGVPTTITQLVPRIKPGSNAIHPEMIQVEDEQDLVTQYLYIKHDHQTFKCLMTMLRQGIGLYEARKKQARRDCFNPLVWIGWILRAPVFILEVAGLSSQAKSGVARVYLWVLQIAFLVLIILAATKLGISIPWKELAGLLK